MLTVQTQSQIVTLLWLSSFLLHSGRCVFSCERSDESPSPSLLFLLPLFQPSIFPSIPPSLFCPETAFLWCWNIIHRGEHISALLLSRNLCVCMYVTHEDLREPLARVNVCHIHSHTYTHTHIRCVRVPFTALQYFQSIRGEFWWAGGLEVICPDD